MTTFIRARLLNAYVVLPLFICLIFATWPSPAATFETKTRHLFTGEDMFRGLFFLDGQYSETIPELQAIRSKSDNKLAKPTAVADAHRMQQQIIETIRTEHPRFFSDFQAALESGNYVNVQNALKAGQSVTEKAIKQVSQSMNNAQFKTRSDVGTCIVIVYYCSTAYTLLMPVCPTIIVAIAADVAQNGSSLLTEQLVASICRASAHQS
ncbi:hypothetical protein [Spirosoma sp. KNUC1025]|uniref:hypothetical protein n=1 Tax=Spirosoma sp. KNUC1025 TaxID=2894082 RepID=UPI00386FD39C|nr:hypothetical protein LN737_02680 [Spirosoma sp. KNUC1025]